MKSRRIAEMERYILSQGSATMEELRDAFHISINTVRRDVAQLQAEGRIEKVYGGVRAREGAAPLPVPAGEMSDPVKQALCRRAAALVKDGDIVFIDSGTTTASLIEALRDKRITVVTNHLDAIIQAVACENIRVIVLPGEIHRNTRSITGEDSAAYLSHLNTTLALMAANGASMTGVTNSSPLEYAIKKAAVEHTEKAVLLISSWKFGLTSLLTYARLSQFHTIITDSGIPPEYRQRIQEMQIELQIADMEEE